MVVRRTLRDPQIGETDYRLENIDRSGPLKSLFEVPAATSAGGAAASNASRFARGATENSADSGRRTLPGGGCPPRGSAEGIPVRSEGTFPASVIRWRVRPRISAAWTFALSMSSLKAPIPLMSGSEIDRTIVRLSHEILERTADLPSLVFAGIRRRGVPLAQRIARKIAELERLEVPVGIVDITLYRDDLTQVGQQPVVNNTEIVFSIAGKDVLIVDDVLYTGRTVGAAMDALFELGRPARCSCRAN